MVTPASSAFAIVAPLLARAASAARHDVTLEGPQ